MSDDLIIRLNEDNKIDVEEDVPVLPSVKKLAHKFQVNKADDPSPVIVNKKVNYYFNILILISHILKLNEEL